MVMDDTLGTDEYVEPVNRTFSCIGKRFDYSIIPNLRVLYLCWIGKKCWHKEGE
jgi:hypothetical protein